MNKTAPRLLLAMLLGTAACGGSSTPANKDASGAGGKGGAGATGTAGGGNAGATGTAGGSAGATGTAGGGAGATGTAGADAATDASGTAGADAATDGAGTAGADATTADASDAVTHDDVAPVDTGTSATSASSSIAAATGGTLAISDGTFKIQAAGLAADTTISIAASAPTASTPQQATVIGDVLEIGPTGTLFSKPALLTLTLGAVPAGKHAVVSTLVANAWVDLPTVVSGGKAYASLSHLSTYAVRGVDDVSCATFNDDLQCGTGTLTGTWNVAAFCDVNLDGTEFPPTDKLLQTCTDMGTSTPVTGGSATLNDDLTYVSTVVPPTRATLSIMLSAGCTSAAASCDAIAAQIVATGNFVDASCTGTPANGCMCTGVDRPPVLPAASTGSYTATGGKLGFTGSIPARSYCANNQSTPQKLFYSWGKVTQTSQFGFVFTK